MWLVFHPKLGKQRKSFSLAAAGVCYRFDGYTAQGSWRNSDAQRRAMINFNAAGVTKTVWRVEGECRRCKWR